MLFEAVAIVSKLICAVCHLPIIHLMCGRGDHLALHLRAFTVMTLGMSVILAYYTFKSNSLCHAAVYHSTHHIYIQKVCTPLTISND
jgi:membrane protease YdiL (CAAX protease family)